MTYKIRIDTGGTFTDCWGQVAGRDSFVSLKILSTGRLRLSVVSQPNPNQAVLSIPQHWMAPPEFFTGFQLATSQGKDAEVTAFDSGRRRITFSKKLNTGGWVDLFTGEEAPILGARLLTGTALHDSFPDLDFRLATTRGTNALLERKGSPPVFFVTAGFGDLLEIGDQRRPRLFALDHQKPAPFHCEVIEVPERLDAAGNPEKAIDLEDPAFHRSVRSAVKNRRRIAAAALLHSYQNSAHEMELRNFLIAEGFEHVSLSSELAPLIKILPRAGAAVVNAYLHEVMQDFLDSIDQAAGEKSSLFAMTSSGGLEPASVYRPKDSLLSGPAGGVAGAVSAARDLGFEKAITFDMGGTSTDVARYDHGFIYQFEQRAGDAALLGTSLRIETVAAGGGSVCQWTTTGVRVGPQSAGADPGPACYGNGGPLTITDVNLLLGRIDPENFGIPLSEAQIESARESALELQRQAGLSETSLDQSFLEGLLELAVDQMAAAIKNISVREGCNPADHVLVAFGGAGPLHACAIAEKLHIDQILVPAECGVLSAIGLEKSAIERVAEIQVNQAIDDQDTIESSLSTIENILRQKFIEIDCEQEKIRYLAELRLQGQDSAITVNFESPDELPDLFRREYKSIFGYAPPCERKIEAATLRAVGSTGYSHSSNRVPSETQQGASDPIRRPADGDDSFFVDRGELEEGDAVAGTRVIQDPFSTLYLPECWEALQTESGALLVTRRGAGMEEKSEAGKPLQIELELFRNGLEHIVDEMGGLLQRCAVSTNVKERLDFSCALLDAKGQLVASANHIPVHIGAMGFCVRKVIDRLPMRPGDTVITNHPADGGSHLPDVTLITPVFRDGRRIGFVANRAHHAEIGGKSPGSMPPNATCLADEGVVISGQYLVEEGVSRFSEIEKLLVEKSQFPTRRISDNLADLHAQLAANQRGAHLYSDLGADYGASKIDHYVKGLARAGREVVSSQLRRCRFRSGRSIQRLDDGAVIPVTIEVREGESLAIDFSGASPVHPGNLNAPPAVIRSAILYVLQLWTQNEYSLNESMLGEVDLELPESFLNPKFSGDPARCPAVAGGNVETSQRVVDALLEALGLQAGSQGTMNNFVFGDDTYGYYETIGGGAGAGPGYHGASGLHTHMTNTAITDPEILESRYPVRLVRFALRNGSGGDGTWRGGDGLIREVAFLKPMRVSFLSQHRQERPFGLDGGKPGKGGRQFLNGQEINGITSFQAKTGDTFRIETPGGGACQRSD